jgi:uncharacterized membrane protein YfcA
MTHLEYSSLGLIVASLLGAVVNGALGYGFSSVVVPLAILFLPQRTLNPALVALEVVVNVYVVLANRQSVPAAAKRAWPLLIGLLPGVIVGAALIASVDPARTKLYTFGILLPLILLQAAGLHRPIKAERSAGVVLGGALGVLYSLTTISGPPLALFFNNQNVPKREFRAALGLVRLAESLLTAVVYFVMGFFTPASLGLVPLIAPSVLIGVPIGVFLIRHLPALRFRRACISFDAWIVAFACSTLLREQHLASGPTAYTVLVATIAIDVWLLVRFFSPVKGKGTRLVLAKVSGTG